MGRREGVLQIMAGVYRMGVNPAESAVRGAADTRGQGYMKEKEKRENMNGKRGDSH